MNYNKKELTAIETLKKIANALESKTSVILSAAESNAINDVLGFNLDRITKNKKSVKKFVRGKEQCLVEKMGQLQQSNSSGGKVTRHCYFQFQIRE